VKENFVVEQVREKISIGRANRGRREYREGHERAAARRQLE
jgi:hypothetical protein